MLSGSASGDSINTWMVNFIESLLVRTSSQLAERTIGLPSIKPVRVVVTENVSLLLIESVCEIVELLGRCATADSSEVLAIRHKCGRPPAVLRRRRALSRDTYRVGLSRIDRQRGFEARS
jgi:hypothetical protein